MLVRELFCYRPGDGLDVIGHLSEASDDRYVDLSSVVVGAKLLEAGAEAVVVSCEQKLACFCRALTAALGLSERFSV